MLHIEQELNKDLWINIKIIFKRTKEKGMKKQPTKQTNQKGQMGMHLAQSTKMLSHFSSSPLG